MCVDHWYTSETRYDTHIKFMDYFVEYFFCCFIYLKRIVKWSATFSRWNTKSILCCWIVGKLLTIKRKKDRLQHIDCDMIADNNNINKYANVVQLMLYSYAYQSRCFICFFCRIIVRIKKQISNYVEATLMFYMGCCW